MKIEITIEEVISQKFEEEVTSIENAYEEIRKKYEDGEIVVDNACLTQANVMIHDEGEETDWLDLHI